MKPIDEEKLNTAGIDTDAGLRIFNGNSNLYEKFLYKFLTDESFNKIKYSYNNKDFNEMLFHAHSLKGLSGNLGMKSLYNACSGTVELLRNDNYREALDSYYEIESAYMSVYNVLNELEEKQ